MRMLKVFVFGAVLVIGLMTIISVVPEEIEPLLDAALGPLVILGFWGGAPAAILRYRSYDIDRIASRTVTYLITVSVFGYLGSVVALQALLPFEGAFAVAVSTLARRRCRCRWCG